MSLYEQSESWKVGFYFWLRSVTLAAGFRVEFCVSSLRGVMPTAEFYDEHRRACDHRAC